MAQVLRDEFKTNGPYRLASWYGAMFIVGGGGFIQVDTPEQAEAVYENLEAYIRKN